MVLDETTGGEDTATDDVATDDATVATDDAATTEGGDEVVADATEETPAAE